MASHTIIVPEGLAPFFTCYLVIREKMNGDYMFRLFILAILLICNFNSTSSGSENLASEKSNATSKAPTNNADTPKKITENVSSPSQKAVSEIGRPIYTHHTESGEKKQDEGPNESWWFKFRTDPVATFTLILSIVTGLLWWSTRQLVLGAEKTAAQELRAYVFPRIDENMSYASDWYRSVPLMIKNFGQTPAYDVAHSLFIGLYKYPLDTTFDHSEQLSTSARSALAPSEYSRMYACLPDDLNKAEIDSIQKKQHAIFISGKVEYFDAFRQKHTTSICLYSTGADFNKGLLAYYHEGNHAD